MSAPDRRGHGPRGHGLVPILPLLLSAAHLRPPVASRVESSTVGHPGRGDALLTRSRSLGDRGFPAVHRSQRGGVVARTHPAFAMISATQDRRSRPSSRRPAPRSHQPERLRPRPRLSLAYPRRRAVAFGRLSSPRYSTCCRTLERVMNTPRNTPAGRLFPTLAAMGCAQFARDVPWPRDPLLGSTRNEASLPCSSGTGHLRASFRCV